jgi:hypothetical protein
MKKIILNLSIISALILTGCGDDGDDEVTFEDVKIEYKTKASYDLAEYFLPAQNQISNYVDNVYTNEHGKKEYFKNADEGSPSYSISRYEINGSKIKEFNNSTSLDPDTTYEILSDKIILTDVSDNSVMSSVRFADNGNYISKAQESSKEFGLTKETCKLTGHLDEKKVSGRVYNDVIELRCSIDILDSDEIGGQKITVTGNSDLVNHFAKGKGLISSVSNYCSQTKTGDKLTKSECKKLTHEITTIN